MVLLSMALSLGLVGLIVANWPRSVAGLTRLPPWQWAVLAALVPFVLWLGQRAQGRVIYDDDRALRRALLTVLSAEEDPSEDPPS